MPGGPPAEKSPIRLVVTIRDRPRDIGRRTNLVGPERSHDEVLASVTRDLLGNHHRTDVDRKARCAKLVRCADVAADAVPPERDVTDRRIGAELRFEAARPEP